MPDIIKLDFQTLYGKSEQNPQMPELRTLFNKSTILENLGYSSIGKDIRLEDEINELVYKLYGLDENDKKIIEEFLSKF